MNKTITKLNKLKTEYLRLLEIAPQGEERIKLFESKSMPMEKLGEHIVFLENEIAKLRKELLSDGIDVNNYLENNNLAD